MAVTEVSVTDAGDLAVHLYAAADAEGSRLGSSHRAGLSNVLQRERTRSRTYCDRGCGGRAPLELGVDFNAVHNVLRVGHGESAAILETAVTYAFKGGGRPSFAGVPNSSSPTAFLPAGASIICGPAALAAEHRADPPGGLGGQAPSPEPTTMS